MGDELDPPTTAVIFSDDGWSVSLYGDDPAREDWAATLFATSNGALGVRGAIEERARATTFLAHAFEQTPIAYHERLHGFALATDTRVPVAEALGMRVTVDGVAVDFTAATIVETVRTLDMRRGLFWRRTVWRLADGCMLEVEAERFVPIAGTLVLVRRLSASIGGVAVEIEPLLGVAAVATGQSDDPRIGIDLGSGGFRTEHADEALVIERLCGSGIGVATAQRTVQEGQWTVVTTGFGVGREPSGTLRKQADDRADSALAAGFEGGAALQAQAFEDFWSRAAMTIHGDARATGALRLNLFHLFCSAGRDGHSSAAAKGLTGEGYEGHYFWDTEAFMLPVLAMVAPDVARAMLVYRYRTLEQAIANARALDHEQGALFAWRTIAGRECSAHYPSGSAQYHINAAIAFAVGCYVDATDDIDFLIEMGAELLIETARIWIALGDRDADGFHLRGVTGPDEYTTLIDDNWYTNRMAQKHLRLAVEVARRVEDEAPAAWRSLAARVGIAHDEVASFADAAEAIVLPFDRVRNLDAQDASFLAKPRWDVAGTPREHFPLLLHYHPMTLYRHQVSKQADLILGMVLGGEDVDVTRKRRAFDHYEPITTHDSTLSASTFSILASEIGRDDVAMRFFRDTTFVDVDDQHRNTDHGVHMASLAGSWLALVWGFAGFRPDGATLSFRPRLPSEWDSYDFGLRWRGAEIRVSISGAGATYHVLAGKPVTLRHHGTKVALAVSESWTGSLDA